MLKVFQQKVPATDVKRVFFCFIVNLAGLFVGRHAPAYPMPTLVGLCIRTAVIRACAHTQQVLAVDMVHG